MTTDRRLEILRAIVDEYVETQEPVGSKAIAGKGALGISPATIRNEMAVLEEEGFITQPHTSAGRIPTDRGYRLFVDKLSTVKPLSSGERRALAPNLSIRSTQLAREPQRSLDSMSRRDQYHS